MLFGRIRTRAVCACINVLGGSTLVVLSVLIRRRPCRPRWWACSSLWCPFDAVALGHLMYHQRMNLQAQVELMTVPQEFTRLCNAVLRAEHGDDFLLIDDDRPDRGNDGYLKSYKQMFAFHCFKRVQNKGLDQEIRSKMISDLRKAVELNTTGDWEVERWTFVCNYPITEATAQSVVALGSAARIDVSWRGADYLADVLQKYKTVRELFPSLLAGDILQQLDLILEKLEQPDREFGREPITWVPRDLEEKHELLVQRPPFWEYLLFAGALKKGKDDFELKWRDFQVGYAARTSRYLDDHEAINYLGNAWNDVQSILDGMMPVLAEEAQEQAFGPPGQPGNPIFIEHSAKRIVGVYEELLNWAADLRGTRVSERMSRAFGLAARVAGRPAREIREFIDSVVTDRQDSLFGLAERYRTSSY